MAATYVKEEKLAAVHQFDCDGCGNALDVLNKRARFIACPYCGSQYDTSADEVKALAGKFDDPSKHQPESFVRVGMLAHFFGKKYQVIARTRMRQIYKEYWSEDGETGYSDEMWVYDEWLLISEQRTYFYLIEDVDGFYISREIVPTAPSLPPNHYERWSIESDVRPQIIREMGRGYVLFFEGESNYEVKIDDQVGFALYKYRGNLYSAEWRYDENDDLKEVEFFEEEPIGRLQVMEAFEANEAILQLKDKMSFWGWMMNAAAALFIFGLVMTIGAAGGQERTVFKTAIGLERFAGDEGVFTEPFELSPGLHRLKLSGTHNLVNNDAFILAYFMTENKDVINYVDGSFGRYEGYDDEGYWSESAKPSTKKVKVTEGGQYMAQLFADVPSGATGNVQLVITDGVTIKRWYILTMVVALIAAGIFYSIKRGLMM